MTREVITEAEIYELIRARGVTPGEKVKVTIISEYVMDEVYDGYSIARDNIDYRTAEIVRFEGGPLDGVDIHFPESFDYIDCRGKSYLYDIDGPRAVLDDLDELDQGKPIEEVL